MKYPRKSEASHRLQPRRANLFISPSLSCQIHFSRFSGKIKKFRKAGIAKAPNPYF